VAVFLKDLIYFILLKRIKLFKSYEGYIFAGQFFFFGQQLIIKFTGTKYKFFHFRRISLCIIQNWLEASLSQIFQWRYYARMSQQRLWSHHHQRLAEVKLQLSPEQVEIVCRSGTVGNDHIFVCTKGKETFETCRRVFGTLTFGPVRRQHHQTVLYFPFFFSCSQILVYYDLRTIDKVTKLSFPDRK